MTDPNLFNPIQFSGVLPEIVLMITALLVLLVDLASGRAANRRTLAWITAGGMLVALLASFFAPSATGFIFGGQLSSDLFAWSFRVIFLVGGALTALVSAEFKLLRASGEFFSLLAISTLGMCLMAASTDIIMLYLATETASIAGYLLAGFLRDSKRGAESGLKYFVFGSVTSTLMLYGLSLIYGMTGATNYGEIASGLSTAGPQFGYVPHVALLLVLVGFAFKTSIIPFQFWAPDVYEGAATPITGFISTASKAAGFAIMLRVLLYVFQPSRPLGEDIMTPFDIWRQFMVPIAILTMFAGNLLAAVQTNVKRMLAYSSVAQAGYVLIGMAAVGSGAQLAVTGGRTLEPMFEAIASVIFYLATYMLTNILAFAVTGVVIQRVGSENIRDFVGLSKRAPYLALGMVAAMLSLTGAPPMVGFLGKLFLFRAALQHPELIILVVVGVINVLISVYYYLGVVRAMYADKLKTPLPAVFVPKLTGGVVALCGAGLVFLTFAVTPFWNLAVQAARSLFGQS